MLSIASRIINDLKSKHPGYLVNLVFNNPKLILKYFRSISSYKWIKDYFDDYSEYFSLYSEISESKTLLSTKVIHKIKRKLGLIHSLLRDIAILRINNLKQTIAGKKICYK